MKVQKWFISLLFICSILLICGCTTSKNTKYKVTYITNGGVIIGNYIDEFTNYENYTLALVKKDGFIFQGWYEDETRITQLAQNRDYTLEAKWLSELDNPNTKYSESDKIKIENVEIDGENLSLFVSLEKELQMGVLISYTESINLNHQTIDAYNFYLESNNLLFNEQLINNVSSELTIRPYYIETIIDNTTVYYGEPQTIKLLDLVEKAESNLEKAILDANNIIYEVSLTMNTAKYTVASNSDLYSASIKKPLDYIYIVTYITCKSDYTFFKEVKLIVNDKIAEKGIEISSDKNKITYTIDDPNWTQIW